MEPTLATWQVVIGAAAFVPVFITLLVMLLRSGFEGIESVKYVVLRHTDPEHWDSRPGKNDHPADSGSDAGGSAEQ